MNWSSWDQMFHPSSFAHGFRNLYRTQRFEAEVKAAQMSEAARKQQAANLQQKNDLALMANGGQELAGNSPKRSSFSLFRRSSLSSPQTTVVAPANDGFPRVRYSLLGTLRSDLEEDDLEDMELPGLPSTAGGLKSLETERIDWNKILEDETNVTGGDFPWVESRWFQSTVGGIIFINAIVIGLETDFDTPLWWYIEQLLLAFFCFELSVRILRHKLAFFKDDDWLWNLLDFFIVMSGVIDQWCIPVLQATGLEKKGEGGEKMGVIVMLMRMLRLLRIVRLFRLVRIVRPLYELAQGVLEAVQGMFWVLVLMVMVLYAIAILCTRLIGHGVILPDPEALAKDAELVDIRELFRTVPDSMFALFGSMSSWSLIQLNPLFEDMPLLKPIFVLFYVYSAWALLAVMTGVVSENMISIREQMTREEEDKENTRKRMITDLLRDLFRKADADDSGHVSKDEFDAMLRSPEFVKKVTKQSHIRVQDLLDLFEWIDRDSSGTITIDEFMTGIKWLNEPLGAKSLIKLQESLAGDLRELEKEMDVAVDRVFVEIGKVVSQPLRKVHAITVQMQNLDLGFRDLRSGIEDRSLNNSSEEALQAMDARLSGKINELLWALDDLEGKERGRY
eukprot:gnl/MRDRNA2_/MRDRNA2_77771_c0_seq1.p1 gnl/MRDRNA2_/MRDRNA2_77771_c0~~gnl/MRDRNA2_/MRDRNA2_77771_c0_seq1.p1  ORF type:complete len:620 (+),score=129.78 gnl/MRDRNA2_/MRDRNA2_77771_c0_seq1:111-1970(+)